MSIYILTIFSIILYTILVLCIPMRIKEICTLGQRFSFDNLKIILTISFFSVLSYSYLSDFFSIGDKYGEKQVQLIEKSENIRPLLVRLKKQQLDMRIYLSEYPNDHIIWSNLGQSYFMVQNFKQARFAFSQALKLKPYNKIYLMNLITSNTNLDKGILKKKDEYLICKFLIADISHTHVINLIALNLYQRGLYEHSLIFWKQILINLEEDYLTPVHDKKNSKNIKSNIKNIVLNIKKRNKIEQILRK